MIDRFAADIIAKVNEKLKTPIVSATVIGGRNAAMSVIKLMRDTISILPPLEIVEAYNNVDGRGRIPYMLEVLGDRTAQCIANGCICLASLWQSAWMEGKGKNIPEYKFVSVDRQDLKQLYEDKHFLEAFRLEDKEFLEVAT
jgi:hypothetical protein